jgi:hypothetical protein
MSDMVSFLAVHGEDMGNRRVSELHPHPDQDRVYGDEPDEDMVKSVRELGILVPLVVTAAGTIVSGFCRWVCARKAGLESVPVRLFASEDSIDVKEAFVHFNRQRVKTKHQMACEADLLMEVEQERARRRQQATQMAGKEANGTPRQSSVVERLPPPSEKGKAHDKVGKALGVSGRTVDKLLKLARTIREAENAGDTERAEALRKSLNERGVEPTMRLMQEGSQGKNQSEPASAGQYDAIVLPPPSFGVDARWMSVSDLVAPDCVVWLWTTSKDLSDAISLVESWGFRYSTLLTWVKPLKSVGDPGRPEVLDHQALHCVVAVHGRPKYAPVTQSGNVLVQKGGGDRESWQQFLQLVEAAIPGAKLAVGFDREGWTSMKAPSSESAA